MDDILQALSATTLVADSSQDALLETAHRVLPGGVLGTSTMPAGLAFVPARSSGARITDAAGREYIDFTMGSGALLFGHQPDFVIAALMKQSAQLVHTFGYLNVPAIELAAEVVAALPSIEKVRFTVSGGEATFYALRLARAFTGRDKILKFEGGYHGFHDYAMQSFSAGNAGHYPEPRPGSAGIPASVTDQVLVGPFNDLEWATEIVRANAGQLAAIIVEPVQRIIEPEPGFLAGLRRLADEVGACLIFDEVVTGFRLGYEGAQGRFGVRPDLTTLGKILGGGLPLAAVGGRSDIMDLCAPGRSERYVYQSGTMNGNALVAACGLATLRAIRENPPYDRLAKLGLRLRRGLQEVLQDHGEEAQVLGIDSLWQVAFTSKPVHQVADLWAADNARLLKFQDGLTRHGILLWRGNRSFVSCAHSESDIDTAVEVAKRVLADI